jgi:pentose-5-phosphate-3-epimerase
MLTFQAAATAARSNHPAGVFARDAVLAYLAPLKPAFAGTIQFQGGITTETVGAAVGVGAEFLVAGTQIFRNRGGLTPPQVVDALRRAAAAALI